MRTLPFFTTALLVSGLSLASGRANAQVVTTFAGSGDFGHADGVASVATFSRPNGVAVDAFGNVIVADSASLKIRKISAGGVVTTLAGSGLPGYNDGPGPTARFWGPLGVAVDAQGDVWIADSDDGVDGQFFKEMTPDGVVHNLNLIGGGNPVAVTVDGAGNVYFLDAYDGLWKLSTDGKGAHFGQSINGAFAVASDASGNLFVADTGNNRILRVTPLNGSVATLAGTGSPGRADGYASAASFNGPQGVAVDRAGNVYVADTGNNLIRRISSDGLVMTVAGTGDAGSADGPGSSATLYAPTGLALDGAGDLYVADWGNNKIRKISAVAALCGVGCTNWMVPSVAHIAGADGAFWTSDLVLHNRGSSPAPVTLKFLGNSRDGTSGPERSFTLDPLQTVTYADVLSSAFGIADDAGALEVLTPSDQLTVRSRTFTAAAGGTIGDGIPGVRQGSLFTDQTSPSPVLTGLSEDAAFRSNLILVNATSAPLVVHVAAADASGASIGSRDYTLPPLGMIQDSRFLTRDEFGGGRVTGATVTLSSTTPGAAFTACAIVIDNASNAPTTVLPQ